MATYELTICYLDYQGAEYEGTESVPTDTIYDADFLTDEAAEACIQEIIKRGYFSIDYPADDAGPRFIEFIPLHRILQFVIQERE